MRTFNPCVMCDWVQAPLFLLQSKFDHFQLSAEAGLRCMTPGSPGGQPYTPPWVPASGVFVLYANVKVLLGVRVSLFPLPLHLRTPSVPLHPPTIPYNIIPYHPIPSASNWCIPTHSEVRALPDTRRVPRSLLQCPAPEGHILSCACMAAPSLLRATNKSNNRPAGMLPCPCACRTGWRQLHERRPRRHRGKYPSLCCGILELLFPGTSIKQIVN